MGADNRRLRPLLPAPSSPNLSAPPSLLQQGYVPGGPWDGITIHQGTLMNSAAHVPKQLYAGYPSHGNLAVTAPHTMRNNFSFGMRRSTSNAAAFGINAPQLVQQRAMTEMSNNLPQPGGFPDISSSHYSASGVTPTNHRLAPNFHGLPYQNVTTRFVGSGYQTPGPSSAIHPGMINHARPHAVPNHLHFGGSHQAFVPTSFPSANNAVMLSSCQLGSVNQIPLIASASNNHNGNTGASVSRRSREIARNDGSSLRVASRGIRKKPRDVVSRVLPSTQKKSASAAVAKDILENHVPAGSEAVELQWNENADIDGLATQLLPNPSEQQLSQGGTSSALLSDACNQEIPFEYVGAPGPAVNSQVLGQPSSAMDTPVIEHLHWYFNADQTQATSIEGKDPPSNSSVPRRRRPSSGPKKTKANLRAVSGGIKKKSKAGPSQRRTSQPAKETTDRTVIAGNSDKSAAGSSETGGPQQEKEATSPAVSAGDQGDSPVDSGGNEASKHGEVSKMDHSTLKIVPGMTPQEKHEIKRLRNQLSGARSRKRKMDEGEQLRKEVAELQEKNPKMMAKWIELRDLSEKMILDILTSPEHPQAEARLAIAKKINSLALRVIGEADSNSPKRNLNLEQ